MSPGSGRVAGELDSRIRDPSLDRILIDGLIFLSRKEVCSKDGHTLDLLRRKLKNMLKELNSSMVEGVIIEV